MLPPITRLRLERYASLLRHPTQDPLYQKVKAAYEALHVLNVELHCMSCKSGVGRPERSEE